MFWKHRSSLQAATIPNNTRLVDLSWNNHLQFNLPELFKWIKIHHNLTIKTVLKFKKLFIICILEYFKKVKYSWRFIHCVSRTRIDSPFRYTIVNTYLHVRPFFLLLTSISKKACHACRFFHTYRCQQMSWWMQTSRWRPRRSN